MFGLTITPEKVAPDEAATINVLVSNTGDIQGTINVIFKVNDSEMESREVSLEAGQSEPIFFQTQQSVPGEYTVDVNGNSGRFTVEELQAAETSPLTAEPSAVPMETALPASPEQASPSHSSPPASTDGGMDLPVIWIIVGSLIVIGAAVGVVLGRRKPPD